MIKRLAVGGAALLALTGMSATGAVASTTGARHGLTSRVVYLDIHGTKATVTLRGDWRLGKAMTAAQVRRIEGIRKAANASEAFYNWGGYFDSGHNVAFRFAAADFNAPNVQCNSSLVENGQSALGDAAGLGGATGGYGEQAGFLEDCDPGAAPELSFSTFWAVGTSGNTVTGVEPGDSLSASVYYNSSGQYQLAVNDLTEPGGFSVTESCPSGISCNTESAEVLSIAEGFDPSDPADSYALADYGTSWFNAAAVTSRAGTRGTLSANSLWSPTSMTTVYPSNDTIQTPGSLLSGGTGFEETWKAAD
jgi:hypothetical protein